MEHERLSEKAIEIVNELHHERLDYESEYVPLIDAINRLAELEDKIENGTLVELPCKVGDIVYEAIKGMPILEWEVESLSFNTVYPKGVLWVRRKTEHVAWKFWGEDFGNKIFTTKEAAEAKLKELKRGKNERQ